VRRIAGRGLIATLDVRQTTAGAGAVYTPVIRGVAGGLALGVLQFPLSPALVSSCAADAFTSASITIDFVTVGAIVG